MSTDQNHNLWDEYDGVEVDPLLGDAQPLAGSADVADDVSATDRDRRVSVRLRRGRLASIDMLPTGLGQPEELTGSIIEAVNAALDLMAGGSMESQVWKERMNEIELLQYRADATIANALDATRALTRDTERLLGYATPPPPLR